MKAAANSCSAHRPVSKSPTAGDVSQLRRKSSGCMGAASNLGSSCSPADSTSTPPRSNSNTSGIAIPPSPHRIVCRTRPLADLQRDLGATTYGTSSTCPQLDWLVQGVLVDRPPPTLTRLRHDSNPAQSSVRGTYRFVLEPVVLKSEDAPGHVGSGTHSIRALHSRLSPGMGAGGSRRAHVSRIARMASRLQPGPATAAGGQVSHRPGTGTARG